MTTIEQMSQEPAHASRLVRALALVPRMLASKPHIIFLGLLGVYLVILPLFSVHVSAFAELVGGNYTNVTSDLGACIAAGGTIHLIHSHKQHRTELARMQTLLLQLEHRLDGQGGSPKNG